MTEQTNTLTADEIAALPGMVDASTPGPWDCHYGRDDCACDCKGVLGEHGGMGAICVIEVDNGMLISEGGNDAPDEAQARANARLIALAPRLAATVIAQQREIERLRTGL